MNLLTKLRENLRRDSFNMDESANEMYKDIRVSRKNKIAKKVAGVALALGIATAPITLSACNITIDPDNGITIERPNDDPNTDNPSTDNPSTDDPTTDNPPEEITSQHSEIFNTVVYGDYYNQVEENYFENINKVSNITNPIPYKFLEDEGYDIDAIKEDQYKCLTNSYIYDDAPNDLYVSVKIENPNTINGKSYYTNYILKYNLTDQEKEDMDLVYSKNYIEAPFFIQELSYQKKPEIQSETKWTMDTYDVFRVYYIDHGNRNYTFDLINTFIEDDSIGYTLSYSSPPTTTLKYRTTLTTSVQLGRWNSGASITNGVFETLYPDRVTPVESDLNSSVQITNYGACGNVWFSNHDLENDLENELSLTNN